MDVELPYSAEYAKSGRSSCKFCKKLIPLGSLRLAAMVQSAFHDAKQPMWFHEDCYFKKQRPHCIGDIENFENIRFEDQERIRKKVDAGLLVFAEGDKKGKKRTKEKNSALNDFGIEYAKSGRATCRGCEQKILKDQVRIRKTVYDTEVGMKYGGQPLWHHLECFVQLRSDLGWLESGDFLPGFKSLKKQDQSEVSKMIPFLKTETEPDFKKPKIEQDIKEEKKLNKLAEKQCKRLFKLRDLIAKHMQKRDIIYLLEYNNQDPVTGDSGKLLDQFADMVTFGALASCLQCKGRQILFSKFGYLCNGQLTEWTKCSNIIKEPQRTACKISNDLMEKYDFLSEIKNKPEERIIRYNPPSATVISSSLPVKKEEETNGPKVKRERPPLHNMRFAYIGKKDGEKEIKMRLNKLGGELATKITEYTVAIFSTSDEVQRMGSRMVKAKELGIHVIPLDYLDLIENSSSSAINCICSTTLCDWGTDPNARIPKEDTHSSISKSIYTKSVAKSMTLKIKGGLAVDPESGLEDIAHVYTDRKDKYSVVLGLTDIQRKKNSYYKLQLLESDTKNRYWIFRSWGRIGTTIGDHKLESFPNCIEAKKSFYNVYHDKTGNDFNERNNFVKVPGRMYPIDIDYKNEQNVEDPKNCTIKSKLDLSVQNLMQLLFDVDTMKRTMMLFDLDMEKMPLGKLSTTQIQSAYRVLTEVYDLIQKGGSSVHFIDATNRFYTLIPHNFGVHNPPLLDTIEQVEKHRQVLDSLLEIECAYNLLQTESKDEHINVLDKHYEQLKTKIEPLKKNSKEFKLLELYVHNTHAETHKMYELEIVDIFKVVRQGEGRRYKPFKKLENRKLLWHGSRLTNFAGILSHGLKIAPPEAPVTGYMFGKGIYFADMVSKSANYCCTTSQDPTGLMVLSEVALGDMMECTTANYVTKLPAKKNSTLGRGRTMPNPKESHFREDGVEIPLGKPITDPNIKSSLLYNEYIVYDIAQVNIQYLFRLNFKYIT